MIISKDLFLLGDQDYLRLHKDDKRSRNANKTLRSVSLIHIHIVYICILSYSIFEDYLLAILVSVAAQLGIRISCFSILIIFGRREPHPHMQISRYLVRDDDVDNNNNINEIGDGIKKKLIYQQFCDPEFIVIVFIIQHLQVNIIRKSI